MIHLLDKPTLEFDFLDKRPISERPLKRFEIVRPNGGRRRILDAPRLDAVKDPERWGRKLARRNMSFLTGTNVEVLYSSIALGTQLASFTTEDNLMKTLPVCMIPAGFFFSPNGATGKTLRVKVCGRLGTTGAPTFTWSLRLLTSTTWSAAGHLWKTAALTAGTTQTLAPWFMDFEFCLNTLGAPALSTLAGFGEVRSPLGLASPFAGTIPANNTAFTVTTYDSTVNYWLFLSATCGTSDALNLINLALMKVYGEN